MKQIDAALARRQAPLDIFVRNDDGGWVQEELDRLLVLFAERNCPIDVAVIPKALDGATAKRLDQWRTDHAGLGLHQHGFAHSSHEPDGARKCEFGPARPAEMQGHDIIEGRILLRNWLGKTDPIFTPPWNRCTAATVEALAIADFALLSGDRATIKGEPSAIPQLPVTLDWERARREARLAETLAAQIDGAETIGLMLHHETMDESAREELGAILDIIMVSGKANFRSMSSWVGEST
jgi:hypothetical protein